MASPCWIACAHRRPHGRFRWCCRLRTINVGVREASDGVEALDQISKAKPAMVILDVMMPNMDGLTFLRKLRSNPETELLPVLLFTAFRVTSEQAHELRLSPSMIMS